MTQVFNISSNQIQGLPPIWMFADNVPSWAEGGIDIRVRPADVAPCLVATGLCASSLCAALSTCAAFSAADSCSLPSPSLQP